MVIHTPVRSLFSILVIFALALPFMPGAVADNHQKSNSVLKTPPVVEKLTLRRLSSPTSLGNALLAIEYRRDEFLQNALLLGNGVDSIVITLETGTVEIYDDGEAADDRANDGVFSAFINFNFEKFAAEQGRRALLAEQNPIAPVFASRQRVRDTQVQIIDPYPFDIDIDLTHMTGVLGAIIPENSLLITHVDVVEDSTRTFDICTGSGTPMGQWTFGHLMTEMANQTATGIDPRDFTELWLFKWLSNQTINGLSVTARTQMQNLILNPWPRDGLGKLILAEAPFRLLAFVNRLDLRENLTYGGGSAGEARIVFSALDRNNCASQPPFTVIFEYGINKSACTDVRDWAQEWHALSSLTLGSAAYNNALQAITDQFTAAGADPGKPPNESALNQLRTNEIALAGPWELREFVINTTGADPDQLDGATALGHLAEATVKQTPDTPLNNLDVISDYVNANETAILLSQHQVPLEFPAGTSFLAGSSLNPVFSPTPAAAFPPPFPANFFWLGGSGVPINNNEARHHFSLNTCNACHGGETHTNSFLHISPRPAGFPAALSGFLTGIALNDPIDGTPRAFDEFTRRTLDLDTVAHMDCTLGIRHRPLLMAH